MHLLCTFATTGFAGWKADFDGARESRDMAGLTLLQMWQDADDAGAVLCLFDVHDRPRAEEWIGKARAMSALGGARFLRIALA